MRRIGERLKRRSLSALLLMAPCALVYGTLLGWNQGSPKHEEPTARHPARLPADNRTRPLSTTSSRSADAVTLAATVADLPALECFSLPPVEAVSAEGLPSSDLVADAAQDPVTLQMPPVQDETPQPTPGIAPPIAESAFEPTGEVNGPAILDSSPAAPVHTPPTTTVLPSQPNFAEAYAVKSPRRDRDHRPLPLSGPSEPTPQLIAFARRADAHVSRGFNLAQRGAIYTARAEFIAALRLTAAALDQQRQTAAHTRAAAAGLRALEEAEDFAPAIAAVEPPPASSIIQSHHTPRLNNEPDEIPAAQHLQNYFSFAQEQLAAGAGDLQPAASALYALGKLELQQARYEIGSIAGSRAAVYLQAALMVNPQHALAANELGVLLSRHGRLAEAKAALLHSVRLSPQAVTWRNLAIVHKSLGEVDLANRAWQASQLAAPAASANIGNQTQSEATAANVQLPHVEWLEPGEFARTAQATNAAPFVAGQSAATNRQQTSAPAVAAPRNESTTSFAFPWWRKTR